MTELNFGLLRAYMAGDGGLVEDLERPRMHAWRSVARTMVADELVGAGISVSAPEHPWGIAVLKRGGRTGEPLLCDTGTREDNPRDELAAVAVREGRWLGGFESVMDHYLQGPERSPRGLSARTRARRRPLLRPDPRSGSAPSPPTHKWTL